MVDSVAVFPPGFRVTDANGDGVNGAKIKFYETGPGDAKDVFSSKDLTDPGSNLGSIIYTNASGYPVAAQGSDQTVIVYVGADPYAIEITDADDVSIWPLKDNVRGALDTSDFLTSGDASILNINVVNTAISLQLTATHKGKLVNGNPNAATIDIFLPDATDAVDGGDGWNTEIRHTDTLNFVRISSTQNIYGPFGARNAFSLSPGESVSIRCDGATFKISGYTPPLLNTVGIIVIADRITAVPVSPNPGARYIVTSGFTGGGITAATHDIVEATGQGTLIKYTPPSNGGWIAYVQDEAQLYQYQATAWVPLAATQTQMQAATAETVFASPKSVRWHPGTVKAWCYVTVSGTTPTLQAGHNVASITYNSAGNYTVNFTTAFASALYAPLALVVNFPSTLVWSMDVPTLAAGSAVVRIWRANTSGDTTVTAFNSSFSFAALGTSA